MKGSTVTSSCWVNSHYKRLLTFSLGGVSPQQQTACLWESCGSGTAVTWFWFLYTRTHTHTHTHTKKKVTREHAYSIWLEDTVKINQVKRLNYSQLISAHTAYTFCGSNLVMLLDDQVSVFIRDIGDFLSPLCPLELWSSYSVLFTWYQELSQGKSARTWKWFWRIFYHI